MLKAVLFDMDGVLFDSMPGHALAWSKAMTQFGLHMEPEEAYMNEGRTGAGTIHILARRYWGREATQDEIDHIYAAKCVEYNRHFDRHGEAPIMPGAAAVLQRVREAGLMRVIVTGSAQESLLSRIDAAYPDMFSEELMVTAKDVRYGKPHPEPYLIGLHKAGVEAAEAIVVENAPLGVEAAKAAGIFTVAVNTGPLPDKALLDAGADRLYPSMQALADDFVTLLNSLSEPVEG